MDIKQLIKNSIYILLIFIGFSAKAQQPYSISGTVSDEEGQTIPGVTVFITNTKHITATNNAGIFHFNGVAPGTYEVVYKMLGFVPYIQSVTIKASAVNLSVKLIEGTTTLLTVNINAQKNKISAADRANYLELFIKNFIGETVNAEKCKLLNPQVLNFSFNKAARQLKVSTDEFLQIENKALGYELKYMLTGFELDLNNRTCVYTGYPYFEDMKGTTDQQKKWEDNRRVAYLSSKVHFLRALTNNKLTEEGYLVYICTNLLATDDNMKFMGWTIRLWQDKTTLIRNTVPDSVLYTALPLSKTDNLFINGEQGSKTILSMPQAAGKDTLKQIYIVYTGEKEQIRFYKTGTPLTLFPFIKLHSQKGQRQISMIRPLADTLMVNTNGGLKPEKGFMDSGYWAWQRIADLTPLEYFVDPALK